MGPGVCPPYFYNLKLIHSTETAPNPVLLLSNNQNPLNPIKIFLLKVVGLYFEIILPLKSLEMMYNDQYKITFNEFKGYLVVF